MICDVRRHPRARRANLRLTADGLRITLPRRAPQAMARRMLQDHREWIGKRLLDQERQLDVARAAFNLRPSELLLRGEAVSLTTLSRPIEPQLRRLAREDLASAIERRGDIVKKPPSRLVIRDQRTRWGSCSARGTLSFNFRIVMAPPAVLDYLVVHELVHLDEPNHSAAFWGRVALACPKMREHEAWLKRYGEMLMRQTFDAP